MDEDIGDGFFDDVSYNKRYDESPIKLDSGYYEMAFHTPSRFFIDFEDKLRTEANNNMLLSDVYETKLKNLYTKKILQGKTSPEDIDKQIREIEDQIFNLRALGLLLSDYSRQCGMRKN